MYFNGNLTDHQCRTLPRNFFLRMIQLEQLVYLPPLASECRLLAFTETKVSVSAKVPLLFAQRLC